MRSVPAQAEDISTGSRKFARLSSREMKRRPEQFGNKAPGWPALALAIAGDVNGAAKLSDELNRSFPLDTQLQSYLSPSIRAAVAMGQKNAVNAVELLRVTSPYDLGTMGSMDPVYLRGQAYLALANGSAAVAEFQKIIDHPGVVADSPIGALARLGLARAYALQGDTVKAHAEYQDFLTLWKDADPDIPILKQAKAEYAKLQ
jgi:hypothetical protein